MDEPRPRTRTKRNEMRNKQEIPRSKEEKWIRPYLESPRVTIVGTDWVIGAGSLGQSMVSAYFHPSLTIV